MGNVGSYDRIPVTVLGGYLGAGKTTLLNHVLRTSGVRCAVLLNDFGDVGIDADLIESRDGDTISLTNGCVCCSLAGGFHAAMLGLGERDDPPAWVIVEASGVSDPHAVAQYAHLDGFQLDAVVVLADAEQVRRRAADRFVGRRVVQQLRSADLVVLNKTDLVDDSAREDVRRWLQASAPGVRIADAVRSAVPLELLLPDPSSAGRAAADGAAPVVDHHDEYVSWSIAVDTPIERSRFDAFVTALPESVLRGKGLVTFAGEPDARHVFQLVGRRVTVGPHGAGVDAGPSTRLVLVARAGAASADVDAAVATLRTELEAAR